MTYLLDVNVLIALIDPMHTSHDAAHAWFEREGHASSATCPITENGVVRIVGHSRYANSPGPPATVANMVRAIRGIEGHIFWPDALSLLDDASVNLSEILAVQQVTDTYLLALASLHGGRLATFDRRLSTRAVIGGEATLCLIE